MLEGGVKKEKGGSKITLSPGVNQNAASCCGQWGMESCYNAYFL